MNGGLSRDVIIRTRFERVSYKKCVIAKAQSDDLPKVTVPRSEEVRRSSRSGESARVRNWGSGTIVRGLMHREVRLYSVRTISSSNHFLVRVRIFLNVLTR